MPEVLQNPANPFIVWVYVLVYVVVLGYLGYLILRYRRKG